MSVALSLHGVVKSFGPTRALDGLDLEVAARRGARLPGSRRGGQDGHDPGPAGVAAARQRFGRAPGGRPVEGQQSHLHRRVAYVPGGLNLWPQLSGGEVIDLLGRLQGGIDPARRDNLVNASTWTCVRERARVLEGRPVRRWRSSPHSRPTLICTCSTSRLGARPPHGGRVPGLRRGARRAGPDRAVVEPVGGRPGGAPLRSGDHHPTWSDGAVGHARRVAPPHTHHRVGRDVAPRGRPA